MNLEKLKKHCSKMPRRGCGMGIKGASPLGKVDSSYIIPVAVPDWLSLRGDGGSMAMEDE